MSSEPTPIPDSTSTSEYTKICDKCPPKSLHLQMNTSHNVKNVSTKMKNAARLKYNRSLR